MSKQNITFISTRNRGMEPNLKLLKEYLISTVPDISFSYFIGNERAHNTMYNRGVKDAKTSFSQQYDNIICIDGSLPNIPVSPDNSIQKHILLMECFDYQFKNALEHSENLSTFSNFTHIISSSPFSAEVFQNCYQHLDGQKVLKAYSPLSLDLVNSSKREDVLDKLCFYYPEMRGKKILSVITAGKISEDEPNPFDKTNFSDFIEQLGSDWFVLTNSILFAESGASMSSNYHSRFGYIEKLLPIYQLLYVSDAVITNNSQFGVLCAAAKLPIFCMSYKNNYFEKYMRKSYSALFLNTLNEYHTKKTSPTSIQAQERFQQAFSYQDVPDSYDVIRSILLNQTPYQ